MKSLALVLVLLAWFAAPARGDFDAGMAAYVRGDYAIALKEFRKLAGQGVPAAQYQLGAMYDFGQGLPKDSKEALRWYLLAAEQGNTSAQFTLGTMYQEGHGVPQDYTKAVHWYRKAAEQGDDMSQVNLGILYAYGQGVLPDSTEAMKWFRLAAEQGQPRGQSSLGLLYSGSFVGIKKNLVLAYMWFSLAAAQEDRVAAEGLKLAAQEMTPAQIVEAQRLAREWKPKK